MLFRSAPTGCHCMIEDESLLFIFEEVLSHDEYTFWLPSILRKTAAPVFIEVTPEKRISTGGLLSVIGSTFGGSEMRMPGMTTARVAR